VEPGGGWVFDLVEEMEAGLHEPGARHVMPVRRFVGWMLDRADRQRLLAMLPPAYRDVVADHVTLAYGVSVRADLPRERAGEIVGRVDDGNGVEALVVSIGGSTRRPDGGTYHITWSLDRRRGRQAVESNDVLARQGWEPLAAPIRVGLTPASKLFGARRATSSRAAATT
jgi:hypothetical protein